MRRPLPQHFKRDGSPKRGYESRIAAERAAGRSADSIYRCDFCGRWHRASPRVGVRP